MARTLSEDPSWKFIQVRRLSNPIVRFASEHLGTATLLYVGGQEKPVYAGRIQKQSTGPIFRLYHAFLQKGDLSRINDPEIRQWVEYLAKDRCTASEKYDERGGLEVTLFDG